MHVLLNTSALRTRRFDCPSLAYRLQDLGRAPTASRHSSNLRNIGRRASDCDTRGNNDAPERHRCARQYPRSLLQRSYVSCRDPLGGYHEGRAASGCYAAMGEHCLESLWCRSRWFDDGSFCHRDSASMREVAGTGTAFQIPGTWHLVPPFSSSEFSNSHWAKIGFPRILYNADSRISAAVFRLGVPAGRMVPS
jgi:hypothetical protein